MDYLKKEAYPVMKEAAIFWLENLTPYEKYLIVTPSVSAEHGIELKDGKPIEFSSVNGEETDKKVFTVPAYQDIEMVYDLFSNVIDAANILNIDKEFKEKISIAKDKLYPLKKGKYGQLQEWIIDADNPRDHHRHIAHLYGMFPGNMISYTHTPGVGQRRKKFILEIENFRKTWKSLASHRRKLVGSLENGYMGTTSRWQYSYSNFQPINKRKWL